MPPTHAVTHRAQQLARSVALVVACSTVWSTPGATQTGFSEDVRWVPAPPSPGGLALLEIDAPGAQRVDGVLAGQLLHFERTGEYTFTTMAAVPISTDSSVTLTYTILDAGGVRRARSMQASVTPKTFPVERLRVDPRFSATPDSALAARIRRESAAARAVSERSHRTARLWHGAFQRPLPGRITSPFGNGREFNGELRSRHTGIDFSGSTGDSISVVNDGVVALVGEFYYGGTVAYVNHGAGLVTAYLHMSEVLVAEGDTVTAGSAIGHVGATGRVTGPHLHLIARYGTITVNGADLLALDGTRFPRATTPR